MTSNINMIGSLARVRVVSGEERLGVLVAVDPKTRGIMLATARAMKEKTEDGKQTPKIVIIMGHAIETITQLSPTDFDTLSHVMEWATKTIRDVGNDSECELATMIAALSMTTTSSLSLETMSPSISANVNNGNTDNDFARETTQLSTGILTTTRFAPSPSGYLHLGHAYAALYALRVAGIDIFKNNEHNDEGSESGQRPSGRFIVRFENLDAARCNTHYEEAILEDLKWLGISKYIHDNETLRQSDRMDAYRLAIKKLDMMGVLYKCFCSRKDIRQSMIANNSNRVDRDNDIDTLLNAPQGEDAGDDTNYSIYPGICRGLSDDERTAKLRGKDQYTLRINVEKAFRITGKLFFEEYGVISSEERHSIGKRIIPVTYESVSNRLGDTVLARIIIKNDSETVDGDDYQNLTPAYHLSVVVDDHFQGVTRVTRGQDLFSSTHLHVLLRSLLFNENHEDEFSNTLQYEHHKLIVNADTQQRLAKRDHPPTLRGYRESGRRAEDLVRELFD